MCLLILRCSRSILEEKHCFRLNVCLHFYLNYSLVASVVETFHFGSAPAPALNMGSLLDLEFELQLPLFFTAPDPAKKGGSNSTTLPQGFTKKRLLILFTVFISVFRIRIRTDPHKEMPPGSGSVWTDADPDPGVKKAQEMYRFIR